MNIKHSNKNLLRDETGAISVLTAIILFFVLIGIAALAIDIGKVATTKNELQNAADSAALAGARNLGRQYLVGNSIDEGDIKVASEEAAEMNLVNNQNFTWSANDEVIIGWWRSDTFYAPPQTGLGLKNAVKVTLRQGGISTFFARVLGFETFSSGASATAALTGASTAPPDGDTIPVGISKYWFDHAWPSDRCDQPLKFYPTNNITGCAGWHTYEMTPPNTNKIRQDILEPMTNNNFTSSELSIGDGLNYIGASGGGHICQPAQPDFQDLWNAKRLESEPHDEWEVTVVVYDRNDCSNPNTTIPIVGFVTAIITDVLCEPDKIIDAIVLCDQFIDGSGGGGDYGTYGTIPNLVE